LCSLFSWTFFLRSSVRASSLCSQLFRSDSPLSFRASALFPPPSPPTYQDLFLLGRLRPVIVSMRHGLCHSCFGFLTNRFFLSFLAHGVQHPDPTSNYAPVESYLAPSFPPSSPTIFLLSRSAPVSLSLIFGTTSSSFVFIRPSFSRLCLVKKLGTVRGSPLSLRFSSQFFSRAEPPPLSGRVLDQPALCAGVTLSRAAFPWPFK